MDETIDLIGDIQSEIGLNAYVMYPDSRRSIPDTVLWGFASACLLEFVKSFVDFKGLGEALRKRADSLLSTWKAKAGFEAAVAKDDPVAIAHKVLAALPAQIKPEDLVSGTDALRDALLGLGIKPAEAQNHAQRIAGLVEQARQHTK